MDFNHKGDDDKTSTYFASSASRDGYFNEQALRAMYRELEKEKIREEIIAAERRALEMEVRRELLLERELARQQRGYAHGFSLMGSSASMLRPDQRLSLMLHPETGKLDESFAAFPTRAEAGMNQGEGARLEERVSLPPPDVGVVEQFPLQISSDPRVGDVKPLSEVSKGQVLFLPQRIQAAFPRREEPSESYIMGNMHIPQRINHGASWVPNLPLTSKDIASQMVNRTNSSLIGMKRKAVEPLAAMTGAGELPSIGSKKKPPQEWNCALCKVTTTSEKSMRDHLQGRKHKSKGAALLASKTISKNTGGSTSSTKGNDKPTMTANTTNNSKPKKGKKKKGIKKRPIKQDGVAPVPKRLKLKSLTNWCEVCQVGTFCQNVMDSHQRGKKHLLMLEQLKKGNGSISEKPINIGNEAKEANGETENVNGKVVGVEVIIKENIGEATEDKPTEVDMVDRSIVEEPTELQKGDLVGPSSVPVAVAEGK
ncbi:hypothetical protein NE237_024670 [Protea cynaroides]|uniref:U1-type domain-containing protein n=1 Tax=Protea cynaroides TaxID=273540 RepID=A0A9Q0JYS3_9MAGN|nr:hypothetical protein NE237_024670 [Protea cynaroides]